MGILLICWGWDSSAEHACLPVVSPGMMLWSLQQDNPALFTGVQQKLGSARGSKLRGHPGLLDVGLLPQGLNPSRSLGHSPEASYRQGRGYGGGEEGKGNLSMALTNKSGNSPASPPPLQCPQRDPGPCSSRCVLDAKGAFCHAAGWLF